MKKFKVNNKIDIICKYVKTKNGFKHEAELFLDSQWVYSNKHCYQNRTWERYEFESVLMGILDKAIKGGILTEKQKVKFLLKNN